MPASATASIIETSHPSPWMMHATSPAYFAPGSSQSGHISTRRPARGSKFAFSSALQPDGEVMQALFGNIRAAASAAFSPSQKTTGASELAASLSKP
jgi:hypothetical protein